MRRAEPRGRDAEWNGLRVDYEWDANGMRMAIVQESDQTPLFSSDCQLDE